MEKHSYKWKRFWSPIGTEIDLGDGGFLRDPEVQRATPYSSASSLSELEEQAETPCLVLLGEPGMGKSRTLAEAYESHRTRARLSEYRVLWADLKGVSEQGTLREKLFENETFGAWLKGTHRLELFVDGLDECLLRLDRLANILAEEFRDRLATSRLTGVTPPVARLRLRLACRTVDWQHNFREFENSLKKLWDDNGAVRLYTLAPLRRVDVEEAARGRGLDASALVTQIEHVGVVPLATKPVTLEFLIHQFKMGNGQFPGTQSKLYEDGCRHLCDEIDRPRQKHLKLDADQRLEIGSRIAAISIFCRRPIIWTGIDYGDRTPDEVTVYELKGDKECVHGNELEIGEPELRETLGTALFASGNNERLVWSHQTYAEFLAARYLMRRNLPLSRKLELIRHPNDPQQKIIPQLRETAAWLATMDHEIFRDLMWSDPDVLLRSDVAMVDEQDRARLLKSLLEYQQAQQLPYPINGTREQYRKLAYRGIREQLSGYLRERTHDIGTRLLVLDIAGALGTPELLEDILKIALNVGEAHRLRTAAVRVVLRSTDLSLRHRLTPLLADPADPQDELKGHVLYALWPKHIGAVEMLVHLTPPKSKRFIGMYRSFLVNEGTWSKLDAEGVRQTLQWLSNEGVWLWDGEKSSLLIQRVEWIVSGAVQWIEHPGMFEGLAGFLRKWLVTASYRENSFSVAIATLSLRRRPLLAYLVEQVTAANEESDHVVLGALRLGLVSSDDVSWMIEHLGVQPTGATEEFWSKLIWYAFDKASLRGIDEILEACERSLVLREAFKPLLLPIDLGSDLATTLKARYALMEEAQRKVDAVAQPTPPTIAEEVEEAMNWVDENGPQEWWRVVYALSREPESMYPDFPQNDIPELPGWHELSEDRRARVVAGAKSYLVAHDPFGTESSGEGVTLPMVAGYRALRFLLSRDRCELEALSSETWSRWASIVLSEYREEDELDHELLRLAYQHAPDEIVREFQVLLDHAVRGERSATFMRIERLWDEHLAQVFRKLVVDKPLPCRWMITLLATCLRHGDLSAVDLAEQWLRPKRSGAWRWVREGNENIAAAGALLLEGRSEAAWNAVVEFLDRWPRLGRRLFFEVEHLGSREAGWLADWLSEEQSAELFLRLERLFPHAEDPQHEGFHWVSRRDEIVGWRENILNRLKARGTPEAVAAIEQLGRELPHLRYLKWVEWDARELARRETWNPLKPTQFLEGMKRPDARFIQSNGQLLELVLESLERLQQRLVGETPAAIFLWNEWSPAQRSRGESHRLYRPKHEEDISDFVTTHLDNDLRSRGVILNREVQIRRGRAGSRGQRTDITVEVAVPGRGGEKERVGVIIEVKGCWNAEANTAMKSQLVDRYLADNPDRLGLFLVTWFNREIWDRGDGRRRKVQASTADDLRTQLEVQAKELSHADRTVAVYVLDASLSVRDTGAPPPSEDEKR